MFPPLPELRVRNSPESRRSLCLAKRAVLPEEKPPSDRPALQTESFPVRFTMIRVILYIRPLEHMKRVCLQ
jgi:hypothetical protein